MILTAIGALLSLLVTNTFVVNEQLQPPPPIQHPSPNLNPGTLLFLSLSEGEEEWENKREGGLPLTFRNLPHLLQHCVNTPVPFAHSELSG